MEQNSYIQRCCVCGDTLRGVKTLDFYQLLGSNTELYSRMWQFVLRVD